MRPARTSWMAGTRQASSHSDWCPRLVQASGTDPFGTRAHNPVGAAQRNNQPPWGLEAPTRDGIYALSPLHGVLPGIRTQNLLIRRSNKVFPQINVSTQEYSKLQFIGLPGRPHYCYGCATSARAQQTKASDLFPEANKPPRDIYNVRGLPPSHQQRIRRKPNHTNRDLTKQLYKQHLIVYLTHLALKQSNNTVKLPTINPRKKMTLQHCTGQYFLSFFYHRNSNTAQDNIFYLFFPPTPHQDQHSSKYSHWHQLSPPNHPPNGTNIIPNQLTSTPPIIHFTGSGQITFTLQRQNTTDYRTHLQDNIHWEPSDKSPPHTFTKCCFTLPHTNTQWDQLN